jgi:tape measure domain-containing protein
VSVVANVAINVDSSAAVSKLRDVHSQADATQRAFDGLGAAVRKLAIAFAGIETVKFIFAKTAELESQTRSLEVLTGSAQKAKQIIQELQQLGAVTPFTSTELIDAAKRLQAFGVETNKVVETTKRLADVSGATGAELQNLVTAYGQVQAKGRLQGEELLQFQERGIALQAELRKMYGLSGDEFQKALEKGRIGAEAVEVAIVRLTNTGGKYADGAIAQSNTLAGKFSTLTDGIEMLAKRIGEVLKPALKEVLDFANLTINAINNALAGPDLKKANDRLFNINARIKDLKQSIAAGEKAGIGTAAGPQILGVDGQVLGGGVPALPGLKFELQQLQKEAKQLQDRIKELRSAPKPKAQQTPATPALSPGTEKEKKPRRKSLDELIGGDIKRTLEERQAFNELQTAQRMGGAGTDQAKRMIEFAGKYRSIANEILAINETITKVEAQRDVLQANGINVNEKLRDLSAERRNLVMDLNVQLQTQYNQATEAETERLLAVDELLSRAQYELELARQKDPLKRAELQIDQQLKSDAITKLNLTDEQLKRLKDILMITEQIKNESSKNEEIFERMSSSVAGAFSSAIDAVTDSTKTLGDALGDIGRRLLATIGNMLIMYGIAQALGALGGGAGNTQGIFSFLAKGFGFRANGGPVSAGAPYVVGEHGPELFVPGRNGSVVSNSGLRNAMGAAPSSGSPVLNMSFQTTSIGGVEYVSRDQLEAAMAETRRQATRDGASRGMTMTLDRIKQSPQTRSRIGIR